MARGQSRRRQPCEDSAPLACPECGRPLSVARRETTGEAVRVTYVCAVAGSECEPWPDIAGQYRWCADATHRRLVSTMQIEDIEGRPLVGHMRVSRSYTPPKTAQDARASSERIHRALRLLLGIDRWQESG